MNNFRKLLKKIDEIVSKTTVEDIESAINKIEMHDSLKEKGFYEYTTSKIYEYSDMSLLDVNYQVNLKEYNYSYNNDSKAIYVHMEGEAVA